MKERRTQLRVKTDAKVVVVGVGSQYIGTIRDISRGGARIEVPGQAGPGATMSVILQQSASAFFRLTGRVVSCCGAGVSMVFESELDAKLFETLAAHNLLLAAS